MAYGDGYTCSICGMRVPAGTGHTCQWTYGPPPRPAVAPDPVPSYMRIAAALERIATALERGRSSETSEEEQAR